MIEYKINEKGHRLLEEAYDRLNSNTERKDDNALSVLLEATEVIGGGSKLTPALLSWGTKRSSGAPYSVARQGINKLISLGGAEIVKG